MSSQAFSAHCPPPTAHYFSVRKILHIDMDAFYASVEQRDNPALRGIPLAVGSSGQRGVVMTASYEARVFGVGSAMPSGKALRLCPELTFVKPRFDVYREVSSAVRAIFEHYTDLVEPLSLDEAYLDVTEPKQGPPSGTLVARLIKRDILQETGLTASAGVSVGKFLAKVASGMNKPDGLTVILPEEAEAFVARLEVGKIHGVGPVTARRMNSLGIRTGTDLRQHSLEQLTDWFGKVGAHYYRIARGIDERPVNPNRERKSLGAETTFQVDLLEPQKLLDALGPIVETVEARLTKAKLKGQTVTVKFKYADFSTITRSRTLPTPVDGHEEIFSVARDLLLHAERPQGRVRLLGVTVSNFAGEEVSTVQPTLFSTPT